MIVSIYGAIKYQEPERNPFFTLFKKLDTLQIFAMVARKRLQKTYRAKAGGAYAEKEIIADHQET